ncbi:hypothetical protein, partial [Agathobacter rectalis]|uniref:hypothetical protein n=2 Tax=Lachnospiraceae TaxID=186803 RepID=UPI003219FE61
GWCIAFSEGSSPEGCDFPQSWSAPNQTGDATLPLRWLPPATLLWTCHLGTPCLASCSQPTSLNNLNNITLYFDTVLMYNEIIKHL